MNYPRTGRGLGGGISLKTEFLFAVSISAHLSAVAMNFIVLAKDYSIEFFGIGRGGEASSG